MRTLWRITTARFAATAFSGEGARMYGGRWNPKGLELVYTTESRALALLEMMAQDVPLSARYVLIPARLPDAVSVIQVDVADLPAGWRQLAQRDTLQRIGRDWLVQGQSAVLAVPSAVLPAERNYLLNPRHPDFARLVIGEPEALETDFRLLRHPHAPVTGQRQRRPARSPYTVVKPVALKPCQPLKAELLRDDPIMAPTSQPAFQLADRPAFYSVGLNSLLSHSNARGFS